VKTLVQKCNKITELELSFTQMTNKSMVSIVRNLSSLEKLDVSYTKIDYPTILQLKSIPTLKVLRCFGCRKKRNAEKIKNLKLQLPHISINEEYLHIATPSKEVDDEIDLDWFWEIRSKTQDLFPDLVDVSQF
jgi:Leucine-rich repeat (LRR) protein